MFGLPVLFGVLFLAGYLSHRRVLKIIGAVLFILALAFDAILLISYYRNIPY